MDIDIDTANREQVLKLIKHVPAAMNRKEEWVKHNTGVFVTDVPTDPISGLSSLEYEEAENLGYIKLDLLNVHIYEQVKDEAHLLKLMTTPPLWDMLDYKEFVEQVLHIGNHYDVIKKCQNQSIAFHVWRCYLLLFDQPSAI